MTTKRTDSDGAGLSAYLTATTLNTHFGQNGRHREKHERLFIADLEVNARALVRRGVHGDPLTERSLQVRALGAPDSNIFRYFKLFTGTCTSRRSRMDSP